MSRAMRASREHGLDDRQYCTYLLAYLWQDKSDHEWAKCNISIADTCRVKFVRRCAECPRQIWDHENRECANDERKEFE